MREVLMRPSGPPGCGLRSYNSGAGDNFEALRFQGIDDSVHPDGVARHVAGDHEVCPGALQLLQLHQVPLVDVHRQDGINAMLIIRAIDGCAIIRAGRHLDESASNRVFDPPRPLPPPLEGRGGVGASRPIRIRPCRPMWEPIVAVKAASPQLSRKRSVAGGAGTVIPRPTKPGSPSTTGSAGWSSACPSWRAFTCFGRASTCARSRRSARPGARRVRPVVTTRIPMTPTPSMSKTNRLTPWRRGRPAHRPAMSDNPAMRRFRPRWLSALLGGIVLPFDPVLGMVMIMVGLWPRSRQKTVPRVLER